jgi:hypothetical protein
MLAVWPVSAAGGRSPAAADHERKRARAERGAATRRILYQSIDKLRIVDVENGDIRTVPST